MTRKELANKVYELLRNNFPPQATATIWRAIAETDDNSLLQEYERLMEKEDRWEQKFE